MKSYYLALVNGSGCSRNFPWKGIWKTCISPRVAFFAWMSALGKILIMDNLWKRAILIVDWRCMCKCHGELVNHLLLHCPPSLGIVGSLIVFSGDFLGYASFSCCFVGVLERRYGYALE